MKLKTISAAFVISSLSIAFLGSADAGNKHSSTAAADENSPPASAAISDKTAKKISMAIGEETGDFVVTDQQEVEASTGYKTVQYTVRANGGKTFKCDVMEPSKAGKILTLGMGKGADAMCTEFASAGKGKGKPSQPGVVASTGNAPSKAGGKSDSAAGAALSDKAAKKISKAIGEETSDFVLTHQDEIEAPVGYKGTQYTVRTSGGKTFKCDILESSKAGKVMTLGMGSGADAMCTDFTKGSKDKGKTNSASCNALLRAAGKCT